MSHFATPQPDEEIKVVLDLVISLSLLYLCATYVRSAGPAVESILDHL